MHWRSLGSLVVTVALVVAACGGEDAIPIGQLPATTTGAGSGHLEPSEQMRELAEQQCLDDPDLEQGEVNAVDSANPDEVLASVVVDCDDVR